MQAPIQSRLEESVDIFNRLRTDPVFNKTKCIITYYDAIVGDYLDKSLCSWKSIHAGGLIPWSRVYYFKYDGVIIWDRQKMLCSINELYRALTDLKASDDSSAEMSVLSWNILSDLYNKTLTDEKKRLPSIILAIKRINATVICLQEVSDEAFDAIELEFRENFNIVRTELNANNIVLLSRIDVTQYEIVHINRDKEAIVAELSNGCTIVGLHLTSDCHGNSATRRSLQLSQILQSVKETIRVIIVGDFNTSDAIPLPHYFSECQLQEFTYNVESNRFAAALSVSKTSGRCDRLFHTNDISIRKHEVFSDIELSDHYPVIFYVNPVTIEEESVTVLSPSKSSLCLIIPLKFWDLLHYKETKWMPHVSLLFPFLEEITADQSLAICRALKPFLEESPRAVVNGCDYFEQPGSCTVYAKFDATSSHLLRRLHTALSRSLGLCVESNYNPHVTIARCDSAAAAQKLVRQFSSLSFSFPLRRLCHVTCDNGEYYSVCEIFGYAYEGSLKSLFEYIGFDVQIGGSSLFGGDDATTQSNHDVDLLVSGSVSRDCFMHRYSRVLKTCGLFVHIERVHNAYVDYLKVQSKARSVSHDVHYIKKGWSEYGELNDFDRRSLAVVQTSQIIQNLKLPGFNKLLSLIKLRAQQCKIYGRQYGYLSGICWAILVGRFLLHHPLAHLDTENEFISSFCSYYVRFDFRFKIELCQHLQCSDNGCGARLHSDSANIVYIASPLAPFENTVRNMTRSSFNRMIKALRSNFSYEILFSDTVTTSLYVQCDSTENLCLFAKLFDSVYLKLVRKFEKAGASDVVGSNELVLDRNSKTATFHFYHLHSLTHVNTVWCWFIELTTKIFGSHVYVQVK
jgi:endonuclease/exonuclease/phosphatase family metal-dependent hydrolase/2'-5' RNA ligase